MGKPSTIVSNHLGYVDVIALIMSSLHPSFAPHGALAKVPLLGPACRGLQSIFITRPPQGAVIDAAARNATVDKIKERQRLIEDEGQDWNPICIFAEGTTTNGKALLPFKRGAFEGMRTIIPVVIKPPDRYMMPTYEVVEFLPGLIQQLSSFCFHCLEIKVMPEFTPTEWMLDNHRDKGDQDW